MKSSAFIARRFLVGNVLSQAPTTAVGYLFSTTPLNWIFPDLVPDADEYDLETLEDDDDEGTEYTWDNNGIFLGVFRFFIVFWRIEIIFISVRRKSRSHVVTVNAISSLGIPFVQQFVNAFVKMSTLRFEELIAIKLSTR
ncbi:hypothetical protein Q1695_002914 [Nippostrongylus brasiliensis]|nr:hypothetical protein Q1695_002914 [Nippostrongylus brasiliensis]